MQDKFSKLTLLLEDLKKNFKTKNQELNSTLISPSTSNEKKNNHFSLLQLKRKNIVLKNPTNDLEKILNKYYPLDYRYDFNLNELEKNKYKNSNLKIKLNTHLLKLGGFIEYCTKESVIFNNKKELYEQKREFNKISNNKNQENLLQLEVNKSLNISIGLRRLRAIKRRKNLEISKTEKIELNVDKSVKKNIIQLQEARRSLQKTKVKKNFNLLSQKAKLYLRNYYYLKKNYQVYLNSIFSKNKYYKGFNKFSLYTRKFNSLYKLLINEFNTYKYNINTIQELPLKKEIYNQPGRETYAPSNLLQSLTYDGKIYSSWSDNLKRKISLPATATYNNIISNSPLSIIASSLYDRRKLKGMKKNDIIYNYIFSDLFYKDNIINNNSVLDQVKYNLNSNIIVNSWFKKVYKIFYSFEYINLNITKSNIQLLPYTWNSFLTFYLTYKFIFLISLTSSTLPASKYKDIEVNPVMFTNTALLLRQQGQGSRENFYTYYKSILKLINNENLKESFTFQNLFDLDKNISNLLAQSTFEASYPSKNNDLNLIENYNNLYLTYFNLIRKSIWRGNKYSSFSNTTETSISLHNIKKGYLSSQHLSVASYGDLQQNEIIQTNKEEGNNIQSFKTFKLIEKKNYLIFSLGMIINFTDFNQDLQSINNNNILSKDKLNPKNKISSKNNSINIGNSNTFTIVSPTEASATEDLYYSSSLISKTSILQLLNNQAKESYNNDITSNEKREAREQNLAFLTDRKNMWKYIKGKRYVEKLGLRRYLYHYKQISQRGGGIHQSIIFNFNKNTNRINTLDSIDHTGSLVIFNVSVLLKYFFKLIGGALISKPLFVFKNDKIVIKLFFYIKKNIYFFSEDQRNNLFYLLLKNTKNISPLILSKFFLSKWGIFNSKFNNALRKSSLSITKKFRPMEKLFKDNLNYNIISIFKKEFNALTLILENFFKSPIQLEITRIYYPYFESNILAEIIGLNGKKYNFEKVIKYLFPKILIRNPNTSRRIIDLSPKNKNSIVSYLSGIKIKIAGRFYRHKIIPRKTVSSIQRGSLARGVVNFVDYSRYINKSKRGSFCITVTISHIF